jgi:hypothetical protein
MSNDDNHCFMVCAVAGLEIRSTPSSPAHVVATAIDRNPATGQAEQ